MTRRVTGLLFALVFAAVLGGASPDRDDDILPRPIRKHRKAREEQGLPEDSELESLAREYLRLAAAAWPEHVASGHIPPADILVIGSMVAEFKERHMTGKVDIEAMNRLAALGLKIAANYPRYSDHNSQPKSIADQVREAIAFAKSRGLFIPWGLIVADFGRRATQGHRQGFENLLKIVRIKALRLEAVIIDDFDRASRNDLEAWKLAGMCKTMKIGLYGASDGFHIDDPDWDFKVRMKNMFNQLEYQSKRRRVLRGQRGLASKNRPIGRLPLGFARRPRLGDDGKPVLKPDGQPETERCFDPETKVHAELMWDLFYNKRLSTYKIALEFNRLRIDGGDSWSDVAIENMLLNPAYIGLFIWNRTTRMFNWETQKYDVVKNPWQEWEWYYDSELAIVPKAWHVDARNRLAKPKSNPTKKKRKQPQRLPATLFSGTLICADCGTELNLCRSTEKYKNLGCLHGMQRRHGCKLSTSKSTAIIERRLLEVINGELLTEEALTKLVEAANLYLAAEANKPLVDTKPLKTKEKKLRSDIDRLLTRVKAASNDELVAAYEADIIRSQAELKSISFDIANANRSNEPPPAKLDRARVQEYLKDARTVLSQEIPAATEAIRRLTGPILVRQEPYPNTTKGGMWVLSFTPDALGFLRDLSLRLNYPDSPTLEFLSAGNWTTPGEVKISLGSAGWCRSSESAEWPAKIEALLRLGKAVNQIAAAVGCSLRTVYRVKKRLAL